MGLFGKKKICAVCGGKVGFLGYKLAGGEFLCSDCRTKCTPGSNLDFNNMTSYDIEANMKVAEANKAKGTDEFTATREFFTGADYDKPILAVDETHGWFMDTSKNDGWVYNLDDISSYNMRINTSEKSEDEKEDVGFLEWLFEPDFYSAYPELPQCRSDEKIVGAYLKIRFRDNELGVDDIELDVFPGLFTDEDDVRAAYTCCHDFYEFMDSYRSNNYCYEAPAASSAPSSDDMDTLKKLHDLLEAGILTQEEFDAKKKQILGL